VREGLAAVLSVKLPTRQFEGQTKTKLGNPWVRGLVEQSVKQKLADVLRGEPDRRARRDQQGDLRRSCTAGRAQGARDDAPQVSARIDVRCRGKLADCSINDPSAAELFIVEGDSAGGSAKMGRDRTYQAILPLRGKIINSEKNRIKQGSLEQNEIQSMITAIGTGLRRGVRPREAFAITCVIVMTDADVDGSHIRTLILTFPLPADAGS